MTGVPYGPGTGATIGTMSAPPASGRRNRQTWQLAAVGAVVVVALVLASGLVPGGWLRSPSAPAGPADTQQDAVRTAAPLIGTMAGGPWTFFGAIGNLSAPPTTLDANASARLWEASLPCPLPHPLVTSVALPAPSYAYDTGQAGTWVLSYYSNTTQPSIALLIVQGPSVSLVGALEQNATCQVGDPLLTSFGRAVDSPEAAASVAATTNATTFVATHPKANATYILTEALVSGVGWTPLWIVEYDACSPTTRGGPSGLEAYVDGDSGQVTAVESGPGVCALIASGSD